MRRFFAAMALIFFSMSISLPAQPAWAGNPVVLDSETNQSVLQVTDETLNPEPDIHPEEDQNYDYYGAGEDWDEEETTLSSSIDIPESLRPPAEDLSRYYGSALGEIAAFDEAFGEAVLEFENGIAYFFHDSAAEPYLVDSVTTFEDGLTDFYLYSNRTPPEGFEELDEKAFEGLDPNQGPYTAVVTLNPSELDALLERSAQLNGQEEEQEQEEETPQESTLEEERVEESGGLNRRSLSSSRTSLEAVDWQQAVSDLTVDPNASDKIRARVIDLTTVTQATMGALLSSFMGLSAEVALLLIGGKLVAYTSGGSQTILGDSGIKDRIADGSAQVFLHTHPLGGSPSSQDYLQAGTQTQFLRTLDSSRNQVNIAFRREGITGKISDANLAAALNMLIHMQISRLPGGSQGQMDLEAFMNAVEGQETGAMELLLAGREFERSSGDILIFGQNDDGSIHWDRLIRERSLDAETGEVREVEVSEEEISEEAGQTEEEGINEEEAEQEEESEEIESEEQETREETETGEGEQTEEENLEDRQGEQPEEAVEQENEETLEQDEPVEREKEREEDVPDSETEADYSLFLCNLGGACRAAEDSEVDSFLDAVFSLGDEEDPAEEEYTISDSDAHAALLAETADFDPENIAGCLEINGEITCLVAQEAAVEERQDEQQETDETQFSSICTFTNSWDCRPVEPSDTEALFQDLVGMDDAGWERSEEWAAQLTENKGITAEDITGCIEREDGSGSCLITKSEDTENIEATPKEQADALDSLVPGSAASSLPSDLGGGGSVPVSEDNEEEYFEYIRRWQKLAATAYLLFSKSGRQEDLT